MICATCGFDRQAHESVPADSYVDPAAYACSEFTGHDEQSERHEKVRAGRALDAEYLESLATNQARKG